REAGLEFRRVLFRSDVAFRPQRERGDWPDEDRRARLVNDRFAITPDRLLAGVDPMPTTRCVERDNLLSTAQVAEREMAAIAHRLLCPPHEFTPETHPSCVSAAQHAADSHHPDGHRADSDLAARPPSVADDATFDPRHDVDIM